MFLINLTNPTEKPFPIEEKSITVGALGGSLSIKDHLLENRYFEIYKKGKKFLLRDLSGGKTYVNHVRVLEHPLKIGDRIQVGDTELLFGCFLDEKIDPIRSQNLPWDSQLKKIPKIAQSHLSVLIIGPSGVGKDLLTKYIHSVSSRKYGPFVVINCSALSESLAESELFGHIKGSFTGSLESRKGAFETAKNGTLVLDEVGDLPLALQPKLLRALENEEIRPVGSDQVYRSNVRIIACTHQDLSEKVRRGQFRLDLYYRLNMVQLKVPPLRERMEDFEKILFDLARKEQVRFSFQAIQKLKEHTWPGNVRELKNLVLKAKTLIYPQTVFTEDIDDLLEKDDFSQEPNFTKGRMLSGPGVNQIKVIEKIMMEEALIANKGNIRRSAESIGIPKSTFCDKVKNYKIDIATLVCKSSKDLSTFKDQSLLRDLKIKSQPQVSL